MTVGVYITLARKNIQCLQTPETRHFLSLIRGGPMGICFNQQKG